MAAIIHLVPEHELGGTPARRPTRSHDHPHLRVVEGGRSDTALRRRAVYRQRRLVVAGAATLVAVLALSLFSSVEASGAGSSGVRADVPSEHVVRSGDTLWSIAHSLHLGGDVRDVVGALTDENGSAALIPGHVVRIPESLRS